MEETKNYFKELNNISVTDKIEEKNGLSYLSWAWAWGELKKLHPNATYIIYENKDGWNYFTDGRTGWVKTGVIVDGLEHIEYLPIMDFKNKSILLENITSFDVNKAIQRSLTKAVARHGLGLYIYAGEDLPEIEKPESKKFDLTKYEKELKELEIDISKVAIAYKTTINELTDEIVQNAIKRKKELIAKEKENGK